MNLSPDLVCGLILKIRRLHGKEIAAPHGADGSNDIDDGMDDALLEGHDGGNLAEVRGLLEGLGETEAKEFAALLIWGRDRAAYQTLDDAKQATENFPGAVFDFIQNDPAAAEYLAAGLEAAGHRCDGVKGVALAPGYAGTRAERMK